MIFCSDCKNKYLISGSPCSECKKFDKRESGNPAVTLLEKITAEIEDKRKNDCPETNQTDCEWGMSMAYEVAILIIDDHIAELKGSE